MRITALLENTTIDTALRPKHGLSIYIETPKHKVLFDLGPDDTCLDNAQIMGIDLAQVDTVVLSHGHYDHGGALASFLKINDKARLFFHKQAFEPHYHKRLFVKKYVGLDTNQADNARISFTGDTMRIDDELFLFSDVEGLASELSLRDTEFYTCHCTGNTAFEIMRGIMGNKIHYLATGSVIEF